MELDSMTIARARLALRQAIRNHLFDPNVHMVSLGLPEKGGQIVEDELAIRFHVREKFSPIRLELALERGDTSSDLREPIKVGRFQFQTDIVQGRYRPHVWPWRRPWPNPAPSDPRAQPAAPLRGGIGISDEFHNAYGTLGAKVIDRASGAEMILSNWHVLVVEWRARPGQRIYQPARGDGGAFADTVATLTRDVMSVNLDAAVATLTGARALINDQLDLGPLRGVGVPQLGMEVVKSGRRTGITYGRVIDVLATARISYGTVDKIIRNVMSIEPRTSVEEVSGPGDSGSIWIDQATMQAVGLHFAGGNQPERGLAMDIQSVLDALNVDLATDRPRPAAIQRVRPQAVPGFRAPAAAPSAAREVEEELVTR
ncbi:MAG TPA: hypothetical protein VF897_24285 [Roseiflexaceae bacterium]